jgi:FKBP-type peptidyl-prolyl cis-trans isomerase 2
MANAKDGDRVKLHYTKRLKSGRILDTSKGSQPLEIKVGSNIVPLFEGAVRGTCPGETKTVVLGAEEAHGHWRKDLQIDVKKTSLPQRMTPAVGQQIQMRKPDGSQDIGVIINVKRDTITIDMNHPLAGKSLFYDIEVLEIT